MSIPVIMLGGEPGWSRIVFKPEIPDTIKGIQIQFEVKLVKVLYQGRAISMYCLCADITNQNDRPERILVLYQCHGKAKAKKVEIEGKQQRIIVVDKCLVTKDGHADIKEYYSQVLLEYRQ